MNMTKKMIRDLREQVLETLEWYDGYGCDLHNECFNMDYFIVGSYEAKKYLEKNTGVFEAIGAVVDYEQDNFGEVTTDISDPEKLVNMLMYIAGESFLAMSSTLNENWDVKLTEKAKKQIIKELKGIKGLSC